MEQNLLTTTASASHCPGSKFSSCVMFVDLHPFVSSYYTKTVRTTLRACWHHVFTSPHRMGQLYSDLEAICEVLSSEAKLHLKIVVSC